MEDKPIYKSITPEHELDVDVNDYGVMLYEAEVGAMSYCGTVWLSRDEAIQAARAILKHFGELCE